MCHLHVLVHDHARRSGHGDGLRRRRRPYPSGVPHRTGPGHRRRGYGTSLVRPLRASPESFRSLPTTSNGCSASAVAGSSATWRRGSVPCRAASPICPGTTAASARAGCPPNASRKSPPARATDLCCGAHGSNFESWASPPPTATATPPPAPAAYFRPATGAPITVPAPTGAGRGRSETPYMVGRPGLRRTAVPLEAPIAVRGRDARPAGRRQRAGTARLPVRRRDRAGSKARRDGRGQLLAARSALRYGNSIVAKLCVNKGLRARPEHGELLALKADLA